jgi:uroporphyrinogen decarboxylase
MTSRERVIKAINHETPDKCPIDFGGTRVTGIHADLYVELGKYLGIDTELPRVWDQFQFLARVEEPMRARFQADVIHLENVCEYFELKNENWKVWKTSHGNDVLMPGDFNPIPDERGRLHLKGLTPKTKDKTLGLMPKGGIYFDRYNEPDEIRDFDDPMTPEEWGRIYDERYEYTDEELKKLQTTAKWMHDYTTYAVCGGFNRLKMTSPVTYAGHSLQDWMMRLMTDPDYVDEILDVTAEHCSAIARRYLEAVGPYIDILSTSTTDYGTQDRELFNPEIFKEHFVKPIRKVNDTIHKNTKAKAFYHSCGSIYHLLPYMIEAGIDIINPIQTNAANMDPAKIKENFGKDITIWGCGMDIQKTLPQASPEQIREIVRRRMEIMKPNGGFVFAAEHNLQWGVPLENIAAIYDAAIEFRNY